MLMYWTRMLCDGRLDISSLPILLSMSSCCETRIMHRPCTRSRLVASGGM